MKEKLTKLADLSKKKLKGISKIKKAKGLLKGHGKRTRSR